MIIISGPQFHDFRKAFNVDGLGFSNQVQLALLNPKECIFNSNRCYLDLLHWRHFGKYIRVPCSSRKSM